MRTLDELGPYPSEKGYHEALAADAADPLSEFRYRFVFTEPDLIYLDGNSLGRMPLTARGTIDVAVEAEWGDRLIRSWNEGWWDLQLKLGDLVAPLVGAAPGEVIISDSTSVNLFKLAAAALRARPGRHTIVTDDLNFPGDIYVLSGVAGLLGDGFRLVLVESDGINGPVDGLAAAIDDDTALVSLSSTSFKSGYTYDMDAMTGLAHDAGALMLWDVSHSVGAVPIDLAASGADLAVGCTYKYLNGGPGAPAFLYVRSGLQASPREPDHCLVGPLRAVCDEPRLRSGGGNPTLPHRHHADPVADCDRGRSPGRDRGRSRPNQVEVGGTHRVSDIALGVPSRADGLRPRLAV